MPYKPGDIVKFGFGQPSYDKNNKRIYSLHNIVCITEHLYGAAYKGYFVAGDSYTKQYIATYNLDLEDSERIDHHDIQI